MKNNNFKLTVSQLAEICNVSAGTVDRALNNRSGISSKTKERILKIAKEYGFRSENPLKNKDKIIGVVLFHLYNEYFSELIIFIENICKQHNCAVTIMFSDKNKETERKCIENLYYMGVDGIILSPVNSGNEYVKFLKSFKIPIVTVGNKLDGIPFSGIDDFSAMSDATEYVISKKYSKLLYHPLIHTKTDANAYGQKRRYEGFISAVTKHNVSYAIFDDAEDIINYTKNNEDCAVICPSDYYALKLMNYSDNHIPIIGFDNIYILNNCHIKLDSVAYDTLGIAKSAVEYILFNRKITVYKGYEIIKRGSI